MDNPFARLGLPATADGDEVHRAYRSLVKQCHPDIFQDEMAQQAAQEKMIELNLAYEEALKIVKSRKEISYSQPVTDDSPEKIAERMLQNKSPEAALRELNKTGNRNGAWYALRGKIFMKMGKYQDAHASFREAVHLDPDNIDYARGALDAAVAMKKPDRVIEKIRKAVSRIFTKIFHRN